VAPRGTARSITVIGATKVLGGSGDDQLNAGTESGLTYYRIEGGAGKDTITSYAGSDLLFGGVGDDVISGGAGSDHIWGGDDNDQLNGDNGDDVIEAGSGIDTIHGGLGNDFLNGEDGNDFIYGDDGDDTINGGAGRDEIWGGNGNDNIGYYPYFNTLNEGDVIHGGAGDDGINAWGGGTVFGDEGNDGLVGNFNSYENILATVLDGGAGDDGLAGGLGDHLIGGAGADIFQVGVGAIIVDLSLEDKYVDFDGRILHGGVWQPDGSFQATDQSISYQFSGADLVVSNGTRMFTIKEFVNGAAGILLTGGALSATSSLSAVGPIVTVHGQQVAAIPVMQSEPWLTGGRALEDAIAQFDKITNMNVSIQKEPDTVGAKSIFYSSDSSPTRLGANQLIQAMASFGAQRNVDLIDVFRNMHGGRQEYLELHAMS
jgi:Ca2+-binding RTX toxin-like protein